MNISKPIIQILIDTAMFMEFSDDETLNPDEAVAFMESMSANLKELPEVERVNLLASIKEMGERYTIDEQKQFLAEIGHRLGLTKL